MSNNSSYNPVKSACTVGVAVVTAYNFTKMALLVPLYTIILYLGVQKWKQQRSFTTSSHSDIFTYHLSAFAFFGVLASGLYIYTMMAFGVPPPAVSYLVYMNWYGENYIHILTCVEQYLAVVHPIVYMRLRNARGVRIRNISIGCVWLLSLISTAFASLNLNPHVPIMFLVPFAIGLVAVSFCCLSVLCALLRTSSGKRGRVDQSKQRAFYTITAILVVLWLWLGGILFCYTLFPTLPVRLEVICVMVSTFFWFNLPSGLVLPLLYLHKAGKLSFCRHSC